MNDKMTIEQLIMWQEQMLGVAKNILLTHERLVPVVFVLTRSMHIDDFLRKRLQDMSTQLPAIEDGSEPMGHRILTFAVPYGNTETKLEALKYISSDPEKVERLIETLRNLGREMRHQDPDGFIASALMEVSELNEKDLVASYLSKICRTTEAEAIVKIDESWHIQIDHGKTREDYPRDLAECPEAVEMLQCTLETPEVLRFVSLPFMREGGKRDEGKVCDFGELRVIEDRFDGKGEKLGGRFFGLLPQNRDRVVKGIPTP